MVEKDDLVVARHPEAVGIVPLESNYEGDSPVAAMVQRRWTMLLVTLAAAAVSLGTVWTVLRPTYQVIAQINVAPVVRPILFSDQDTDISRHYAMYVSTELEAMTSPVVISAALDLPQIAELPSIRASADPVADIRAKLSVESVRGTQLLTMSMIGDNPAELTTLVNGIIQTYLRRRESKKREWDGRILSSLRTEQRQLEARIQAKSVQLRQSAVDHRLGGAENAVGMIDSWTAEVQALLTEANKNRALAAAKLNADDKIVSPEDSPPADPPGFSERVATDAELLSLKEQLRVAELSALSDERLGRGPNHPGVRERTKLYAALGERIDVRTAQLRKAVSDSRKNQWIARIRDAELSTRVFEAELDRLARKRSEAAGQQFTIEDLRHEREQFEQALYQIRQKIFNVELEQNRAARVTLESPARAPVAPNIDKRIKYSAAAVLMSMFMGAGAAVLRHRLDTSFHNPTQVTERLGVRVLGSVAYVEQDTVAYTSGDQRILEPIRGISAALLAGSTKLQTHRRLITSPTRGTGKSSVATSLAQSLSSTGRRVLLVDADNHGQGITRRFDLLEKPGLKELLEGTATAEEVIRTIGRESLRFIPAGFRDDGFGELLGNCEGQQRLKAIFDAYDEVIVDSPPVLAKSDALILATLVDEIVLVLRAGHSYREETVQAKQNLTMVGGKIAGVILNAVRAKDAGYGYGYGYGYDYAGSTAESK